MWLFKKVADATTSAVSYTKNLVVTPDTPIQKQLKDILDNQKQQLASTQKMDALVSMTYEIAEFEEANEHLHRRLRIFQYTQKQATRTLKTLQLVGYLLKHGTSGFIDQLRNSLQMFANYSQIPRKQIFKSPLDADLQRVFDETLDNIESRAKNIHALLVDKDKLLKERDFAKMIQQKMVTYSPVKPGEVKTDSPQKREAEEKEQRNQFWNYINNIDLKLENISETLHKQIQKVVTKISHQPPTVPKETELKQPNKQISMQKQAPQNNKSEKKPDSLLQSIESNLAGTETPSQEDADFDEKLKSLSAEVELL